MSRDRFTLVRPDDWHVHLRDGALLRAVLPDTARVFGRALVMPNLKPPVTTAARARAYRDAIVAVLPTDSGFTPIMSVYLTDATAPAELAAGFAAGDFRAAKLYPAGATTNAEAGVTDIARVRRAFDTMQRIGMPLLVHGEVADPAVDIFDREAVFIERVLQPLRGAFPELRVVFEHVTTRDAVQYVESQARNLAATITPHHLMINRNALFAGGINPHMYCLPVAKREEHRVALRRAATSGDPRFFIGTDSAPHLRRDKECAGGCAGIYNAPTALACYAQVFEEEHALTRLEAFVALYGARFYGLPPNPDRITLERHGDRVPIPDVAVGEDRVRVFAPPGAQCWRVGPA